jgi:SLA1 Homology Domain 1 (SHD1) protein
MAEIFESILQPFRLLLLCHCFRTRVVASFVLAIFPALGVANEPNWAERFQYRLFMLQDTSLPSDVSLETAKEQFRRAAVSGYNGVVLAPSSNLIQPQKAGEEYLGRLRALGEEANRLGLGLIPGVMPFDAPDLTLPFDPHMAEGVPVRDQLHVVEGSEAHLQAWPPIELMNPGFEQGGAGGVPGWHVQSQQPSQSVFRDTSQARYGNSSLCMRSVVGQEKFSVFTVHQRIRMPEFQLFRVSVWARTVDEVAGYIVAGSQKRYLTESTLGSTESKEWCHHEIVFNSLHGGDVELKLGIYREPDAHQMWFDEVNVVPVGLSNVLRRPGCPLLVRNVRGRAYQEGRDYEIAGGDAPSWLKAVGVELAQKPAFLRIGKESRIRNGERLRVSYYSLHCASPPSDAALCVSSDRVYEFLAAGTEPLIETLSPFACLLATRYIGTANWDEACAATRKTPGAQWGDSLHRQVNILGRNGLKPGCFVWSDMYEPWADPHGRYWGRNGTFEDAWRYLPKDFVVVNANYASEESKSPRFFAANSYRQVIAGDTKAGEWMQANADIPGIVGVLNLDVPLDEFAATSWGWLPQEVRKTLPPAPKSERTTRARNADGNTRSESKISSASPPEMRIWTDRSGHHTVEAAFVEAKSSMVTLRKQDGSKITVPITELSEKDRRWLLRVVGNREK